MFHIKNENEVKCDAFSSFDELLFLERKKIPYKQQKMCAIYGDGAIAELTACKWFSMFIIGNFDLED